MGKTPVIAFKPVLKHILITNLVIKGVFIMKSHQILDKALNVTKRLYRADGTDTSKQAAEQLSVGTLEMLVYRTIKRFGSSGCIQDQVLDKLPNQTYNSVTPRFRALLDKGFIEDTGFRKKGRSGRSQRVIRAVK